jgi:hypothetical protein
MFSVSPVEPMVSLDNDPVSQTDDQCTSAAVCVIENAAPVQDVALTSENTSSENITTSSVSNRDALFGALGAPETLEENSRLAELANRMERFQFYVATDPTAFGEFPEDRAFFRRTRLAFLQDLYR